MYGSGGPFAAALEASQTKTIDTTLTSYQGAKLRTTIEGVAGEMADVGESQWKKGGHISVIGPNTQRVLNVVLPQTPLTPTQLRELADAKIGAASMGVEVRVFRVP